MAVRIQVRRDTAANWVANNPTLREGEMGIEIDTLKIKIGPTPVSGDATAWNSISAYANVVPTDFNTIADGFLEFIDIGAAGGVVGLNSSKNAIIPGSSIIIEGPTNDSYETTLTVTDPTADRTITLPDASGTLALTSDLPKMTITQTDTNGTATETYTDISTIAFDADSGFDVTSPSTGVAKIAMNSTFKYWEVDGVQKLTAVGLDTVNFKSGTGINITADGNASPQELTIGVDSAALLPDQTSQTGKFLQTNGSTTSWATVDLSSKQDKVTGVSDTEIGYLDGVTSAIQTQLDDKSPIASPTFTGTPAAPTATAGTNTTQIATTAFVKKAVDDLIGGAPGALDTLNELAAAINDDSSYAATISTALGTKQDKVAGVSDTEIGYLNGVTSNIQDQLGGKVSSTDLTELAQDAVGNYLGTGLSYDDSTGAISVTANTYDAYGAASTVASSLSSHESNTKTHGVSSDIVGVSDTQTLTNKTLTSPKINENVALTATATELNILDGATLSTIELNYVDGVTSGIQTQLDDKAPLASPTFTGTATVDNLEIGGTLTFSGTATEISSTNTVIQDPLLYLADGNPGNINDLGFVASYNDGTYAHTGLVKDASAGTWKLFKGVTDEPTNTVNFGQGSLDDLAVGTLTASSLTVGDVSNTEIGYLNGVTSSIQDQFNAIPAPYITSVSNPFIVSNGTLTSMLGTSVPVATYATLSDVNAVATIGVANNKVIFTMNSDANYPEFNGFQFQGSGNNLSNRILITSGNGYLPTGIYEVTTAPLPGSKGPGTAAVFTYSDLNSNDAVGIVLVTMGTAAGKIFATNSTNGHWYPFATEDYIQTTLSGVTQTINGDIALKADTTYVDTQLGYKLDSTTASSTYAPIDKPSFTGDASAVNLTISGNLTVNGTTTNINSTNLVIEDKNIILGDVSSPSNITANGGGITLNGTTDKTFTWSNSTGSWTSSENLDLALGKVLKIDGTQVLSASQYTGNAATVTNGVYTSGSYSDPSWLTISKSFVGLGNVENTKLSTWAGTSNITTLGTISTGTWSADTIATTKGGTGLTSYSKGDIVYASASNTLSTLSAGTDGYILTLASGVPTWATAPVTYSAPTIGSTSIGSGATVTAITGLTLKQTSSTSITGNTATAIDTNALSGFTTVKYTVSIKQGSKIRSSEIIAQTDGTSVDYTEYGIVETGGKMTGILPEVVVSSTDAVFQVTITDAASTNATVKIQKVLI